MNSIAVVAAHCIEFAVKPCVPNETLPEGFWKISLLNAQLPKSSVWSPAPDTRNRPEPWLIVPPAKSTLPARYRSTAPDTVIVPATASKLVTVSVGPFSVSEAPAPTEMLLKRNVPAPSTGYLAEATDGIVMTSVSTGTRTGFQFAGFCHAVSAAPVHSIAAPGAIGSEKPQ